MIGVHGGTPKDKDTMSRLEDIRIRDPFFLREEGVYYLYGTTDKNTWRGRGEGFDMYVSSDLEEWSEARQVFTPPENFWADCNFWAPEVWKYRNCFYMLASFKQTGGRRGVQIFSAAAPIGPFLPIGNKKPLTPSDWDCLDGTLYFEEERVYLVFSHEWTQIGDGVICAVELNQALNGTVGDIIELFRGSAPSWSVEHEEFGHRGYVTDGPFLIKGQITEMIWSSFSREGYALGRAYSKTGIHGKWEQEEQPLYVKDGGHGMVFRGLKEELLLTLHSPNEYGKERVKIVQYCGRK